MMRLMAMVTVCCLASCTTVTDDTGTNEDAAYYLPTTKLVARPAADVSRDGDRLPFEVLEFLGVREGMTVLDVIAAGGYYTEVLAHAVGTQGRVYAQNPSVVLRFSGARNDQALQARMSRLPNVRRLDREFDDLGLVANSVDVAVTALNFHDIYNRSPEQAQGVLLAIKQVLKPGGVLGIIDHNSNSGANHAALHRMAVADAVAAAEAAGFAVERSNLLSNSQDDRTQGPFAEGLRGKTDRFVLKLIKP